MFEDESSWRYGIEENEGGTGVAAGGEDIGPGPLGTEHSVREDPEECLGREVCGLPGSWVLPLSQVHFCNEQAVQQDMATLTGSGACPDS